MGDVVITPINVGRLLLDLADVYGLSPEQPSAPEVASFPIQSFHISLPGRSVLVDAVDYDAQEAGEDLSQTGYEPPPALLAQLGELGITPESITDVVISHAHFDHYGALTVNTSDGWAPAFTRARHYLGAAEWQPEEFGLLELRTLDVIERHGLLKLVEGVSNLGDGLRIRPLPGETPGHQMLEVETDGRHYYFAGDLYHHPLEFADVGINVHWADEAEMRASKRAFMANMAQSGGQAYFTHIKGSYRVVEQGDRMPAWERV